jgi:hypothetical protein
MIHLIGTGASDKDKDIDMRLIKPKLKGSFERVYRPLLDNGMTIEDLNLSDQDTYVETLKDGSKIEWVLPHKRAFPGFINKHFGENAKYLSDKDMFLTNIAASTDDSPPFSYQILIRDYLRFGTPYRSLLLEHGLGSGKSRSAILVAETFREQGLPTLILTPAFLRLNFMDEIHKWAGEDIRITSDMLPSEIRRRQALIDQSYHFIHYNATGYGVHAKNKKGDDIGGKGSVLEQLARLGIGFPKGSKHGVHFPYLYEKYGDLKPPTNMLIIIEEVHNLNRTFIGGSSKSAIKFFLYPLLMMATDCKIVALSGTPIISSPFEMSTLYSLLRGPIKTGNASNPVEFALQQEESLFNDSFVNYENYTMKNTEVMMSRIIGLGSLFKGVTDDVDRIIFPAGKDKPLDLHLKMSVYQSEVHDRALALEQGKRSRKTVTLTGDLLTSMSEAQRELEPDTSYHMNSRQASNFAFPQEIPRPRPRQKFTFKDEPLASYQIKFAKDVDSTYQSMVKRGVDVSDIEKEHSFKSAPTVNKQKILSDLFKKAYPAPTHKNPEWSLLHEDDKSIFAQYFGDYRDRLQASINQLVKNADEYLTLDNLQKYSVKMAEIYRRIVGDIEHGACHLVKDDSRVQEAERALPVVEEYEEPLVESDIQSQTSRSVQSEDDDSSIGSDGADASVDITKITAGKRVIDPADELPKYMDVFKTDEELKALGMRVMGGPALVYSFFNAVEGAGIFSKVLDVHGFTQVTEETWDGSSSIADIKREPRYAFIKGDMSPSMKAKVMRIFNHPANRHGQLIRVVFVTQAAAEGISLYHLRQIHIMERHWDNVMIEQVIGRGFRLRSHRYLADKREREIQIYHYYAERADKLPDDYWSKFDLKTTDTIDMIIKGIADRKSKIVSQLKMIRGAAAIDCKINSDYNNLGIKCFDFRGNASGDAFTAAISDDVAASTSGVKKTVETEITYQHFEFQGKTYIKYPGKRVTIQIQVPDKPATRRDADVIYSVPAGWKVGDAVDPHDFKKAGYLVGTRVLFINSAITEVK